jgi:siroheme synthase
MTKIISGSTSIADAKRQIPQKERDALRMARKDAGFHDGGNSLITLKQHELLMTAALTAYDEKKNAEIFEYVEYRLSVGGRLTAYKRLWQVRLGYVARPFVGFLKQYREIQQRKRLRASKNDPRALRPEQVVEAIERG